MVKSRLVLTSKHKGYIWVVCIVWIWDSTVHKPIIINKLSLPLIMFVTGRAQRRGNKGSEGTTIRNVLASTPGVPAAMVFTGAGKHAVKRRRIATIGEADSEGLVILGRVELEQALDTKDTEGAEPPTDSVALRSPDFNVAYRGLGVLRFSDAVRLPFIDGDVSMNGNMQLIQLQVTDKIIGPTFFEKGVNIIGGDLFVDGDIDVQSPGQYLKDGVPLVPPNAVIVPSITDWTNDLRFQGGGMDFTLDVPNCKATSWSYLGLTHIEIKCTWLDKGTATTFVSLRGMPVPFGAIADNAPMHTLVRSTNLGVTVVGTKIIGKRSGTNAVNIDFYELNEQAKINGIINASQVDNAGIFYISMTYASDITP